MLSWPFPNNPNPPLTIVSSTTCGGVLFRVKFSDGTSASMLYIVGEESSFVCCIHILIRKKKRSVSVSFTIYTNLSAWIAAVLLQRTFRKLSVGVCFNKVHFQQIYSVLVFLFLYFFSFLVCGIFSPKINTFSFWCTRNI